MTFLLLVRRTEVWGKYCGCVISDVDKKSLSCQVVVVQRM